MERECVCKALALREANAACQNPVVIGCEVQVKDLKTTVSRWRRQLADQGFDFRQIALSIVRIPISTEAPSSHEQIDLAARAGKSNGPFSTREVRDARYRLLIRPSPLHLSAPLAPWAEPSIAIEARYEQWSPVVVRGNHARWM